eukprot:TRINITY_DN8394_c0_g1_i1.p1 TRINITY_DN8394_c0_g1~~TRINITY_DN8394_c0_g1_i1.p1  ORF type:complete len:194 (-),score=36.51 TRINITY_DN8394_c0_g1_i1:38-619(-)
MNVLAKVKTRNLVKKKLRAIPNHIKHTRGIHIQNLVLNSEVYSKAQSIAIYLNLPSEVPTQLIIQDSLVKGKTVYVPKVLDGENMKFVQVFSQDDIDSFPVNKWNISEPPDDDRPDLLNVRLLDLIIVPGLAFSLENESRLGRGKGYYDRYLHLIQTNFDKVPAIVSLAFSEQIIDALPIDSHDIPMDMIFHD